MYYGDHWINRYFAFFGGKHVLAGAAAGLFVFIAALIVASTIGFAGAYLRTVSFYLGVFGIIWVTAWTSWGSERVAHLIDSIRLAFAVDEVQFAHLADAWKQRIFDARLQLVFVPLVIVIVLTAIALSAQLSFNPWLPADWFKSRSTLGKVVILWIYAIPVCVLIASNAVAMVAYCTCVRDMSRQPLVPFIDFVKLKLGPIANFGFWVAFSWTVGVVLLIVLFRTAFNAATIFAVLTFTAVGFSMLIVPQLALFVAFKKMKEAVLKSGWEAFLASGFDKHNPSRMASDADRLRVYDFLQSVSATNAWPYDPRQTLSVLGTYLIPIATLAIQSRFHAGTP